MYIIHITCLCCIIVLIFGNTRIDITDPCNPTVFSRRRSRQRNITIPVYCPNGTVIWQYPMATLRMMFPLGDTKQGFEVCIGYIENKSIRRIFHEINGKYEKLPFPKSDEEVCTWSFETNISIKVAGPRMFTTYAGYIPYVVYDFV